MKGDFFWALFIFEVFFIELLQETVIIDDIVDNFATFAVVRSPQLLYNKLKLPYIRVPTFYSLRLGG